MTRFLRSPLAQSLAGCLLLGSSSGLVLLCAGHPTAHVVGGALSGGALGAVLAYGGAL